MADMNYTWREGSRVKIPAEEAGPELERIAEQHGGEIRPDAVVEAARNPDAPLHPHFEWNDAVAAEQHRREQAKHLIVCLAAVHVAKSDTSPPAPQRVFCRVSDSQAEERNQYVYVPRARALASRDMHAELVLQGVKQLEQWARRYSDLPELEPLTLEIEIMLESSAFVEAPAATKTPGTQRARIRRVA